MGFSKSQQLKDYIRPLLSSMTEFSAQSVKKQIEKLFNNANEI